MKRSLVHHSQDIRGLRESFGFLPRRISSFLVIVMVVLNSWDVEGLASSPYTSVKGLRNRGGGRAPGQEDNIGSNDTWEATTCAETECRLIICQITDVYTLENLAHFKTLVEETKRNSPGSTVVSMLTGDFLCKCGK